MKAESILIIWKLCSIRGEANKAYELLKSNDTYELVDLREGDSSIERLWVELEKTLFGQCKSIPDKYNYSSL